uniref:Uncharacterized protein n=1 Tax=Magallana gigas TaxID=29159 RepID=A0A8W8LYB8_MAGGI
MRLCRASYGQFWCTYLLEVNSDCQIQNACLFYLNCYGLRSETEGLLKKEIHIPLVFGNASQFICKIIIFHRITHGSGIIIYCNQAIIVHCSHTSSLILEAYVNSLTEMGRSRISEYSYRFNVYPVNECPMNKTEFETAARRRNCTGKTRYLCAPDINLTSLIEFCTDQEKRSLYGKDNCLKLEDSGFLNHYKCVDKFTRGCPTTPYYDEEIYTYPACLSINSDRRCFVAEKDCLERYSATTDAYTKENGTNEINSEEFNPLVLIVVMLVIVMLTIVLLHSSGKESRFPVADGSNLILTSENSLDNANRPIVAHDKSQISKHHQDSSCSCFHLLQGRCSDIPSSNDAKRYLISGRLHILDICLED